MARFSYAFGNQELQEFELGFGELRILQQECDAGPPLVLRRLMNNEWTVEDVSSTIRLGLVGTGVDHMNAMKTVKNYVHDVQAWQENALVAIAILSNAIYGPDKEEQPDP